jgi:UDP-N-acetylmuramoyl-tripeptide--D-alanyl-D-alanine ligase
MTIIDLYDLYKTHPHICTDSRKITAGCIYVSLKGASFNGNAFAKSALDAGAAYAIVDEEGYLSDSRTILVSDGLKTLQQLARFHRDQMRIPVIGITGSNGKTTTKELMAAVLSQKFNVLATQGNLNNQIGVPLTLLGLTDQHQIAIIEMGASRPGDIAELCDIADPDHGLITNIGKAHMETMGGMEGVLQTKTELYKHVATRDGFLFVHSCDYKLVQAALGARQMSYGALPTDDVQGRIVRDGHFVAVTWSRKYSGGGSTIADAHPVKTNLTGAYNLPNIMAAVAVGIQFGLTDDQIANGISNYQPSNNRSEVRQAGNNLLILDAYNANPSSMTVAIDNLVGMDGNRHSVILGEMLEVGPSSTEEHKAICHRLSNLGLAEVCLVGNEFYRLKEEFPFHFFRNVDDLNQWLKGNPFQGDVILIKGSRGNRLEKAAEFLAGDASHETRTH